MALNLLIIFSSFFYASGYVTINVYDEGHDVNTLSLRFGHCEYHECENFCERLGYQNGTCVDDHCECRRRTDAEPDSSTLRGCDLRACEQLCRRLGFPGGACVGDRCKCDNFRTSQSLEDAEINNGVSFQTASMDVNELRSCDLRACEQLCRRLGFPGGACVGDRCKCDNFRTSQGLEDAEINNGVSFQTAGMDVNELRSCDLRACEQLCRRLGFPGGACVGDRCKCDNFRTSQSLEDAEINNGVSFQTAGMDVNELRSCDLRACEQLCRRLGFPGGACVGDKCKCDNFRTSKLDEFSEDATTLRDCNYQECDQRCRRLGFPGGVCVGNRCKCDNFRSMQLNRGLVSAKINTEYRSCNYHECDRHCRRLKFPGGACVNNRCKCDNFRQLLSNEVLSVTNSIDNPHENDVKCVTTQCENNCSERGLQNGICIEKECYCDIEGADHSLKSCDPIACNISCVNINRLGGMCLQGACICF